ncbi:ABC-2 type transporter [Beutenbergia cavernae DSM 12333]|uniref:ABC-2 type transporter n=1 Tax=Beutenbergia cavernae (strain ATCC BAA-8 / DSM 12333 / CCUG 43141 / JCM 11478 / NBRC 16432 / NCIMB 13614 / HKI 0122) TaxID=471853 RepID=C5BW95_BEUC1|nr:ABC transporter permease [Beutenbergia cavernae]ACQ78553.1 ABC-2 type transporter [Beutenbergia cavernae DSM 12333]
MTTTIPTAPDLQTRRPPSYVPRGMSSTYLRLELRRRVRNVRTMIFSLLMPPVFFLMFGTSQAYRDEPAGNGNVTAYVLVSMALYGALLSATSGGAGVSVERAQGWTRQLRLTPLRPWAYVATKLLAAMALGALSVVVTLLVGSFVGAEMPLGVWIASGLIAWAGSFVFAAFGLFMGYLLPSENVMQILGPGIALLAFAGGLFVPLGDGWFADVAKLMPTYGLAELTRAPLTGEGFTLTSVLNVVVWAALFSLGAAWRFRKDTARV